MSYTKRQIINLALEEIGVAPYDFDSTAEQLISALNMLDTFIAPLMWKGVFLNYPLPEGPGQSSLDQNSNIPLDSIAAVYAGLAIALAPSYGKTVNDRTKVTAYQGMQMLYSKMVKIPTASRYSGLPAGAGNRLYYGAIYDQFIPSKREGLNATPGEDLELG